MAGEGQGKVHNMNDDQLRQGGVRPRIGDGVRGGG